MGGEPELVVAARVADSERIPAQAVAKGQHWRAKDTECSRGQASSRWSVTKGLPLRVPSGKSREPTVGEVQRAICN